MSLESRAAGDGLAEALKASRCESGDQENSLTENFFPSVRLSGFGFSLAVAGSSAGRQTTEAIGELLDADPRLAEALRQLVDEGFLSLRGGSYSFR